MRAKLEGIQNKNQDSSIVCYEVAVPSFDFFWHYHPEFELTYILKGKGKRMVGDSIENFIEGDLVLLGPSLPHTWVSNNNETESCKAIVIQFSTFFIEPFLALPEMKAVKNVLDKSIFGVHFNVNKQRKLIEMVSHLHQLKGVSLITSFFNLLEILARLKLKTLASISYKKLNGKEHEVRINKILLYIQNNFKKSVNLQTASSLVYLSQSAFCKFFKRSVGKTFSDYVNEIRVAHACSLLIDTDKSISSIAAISGFDSLAYFNRVFIKKKNKQPSVYRKLYN